MKYLLLFFLTLGAAGCGQNNDVSSLPPIYACYPTGFRPDPTAGEYWIVDGTIQEGTCKGR